MKAARRGNERQNYAFAARLSIDLNVFIEAAAVQAVDGGGQRIGLERPPDFDHKAAVQIATVNWLLSWSIANRGNCFTRELLSHEHGSQDKKGEHGTQGKNQLRHCSRLKSLTVTCMPNLITACTIFRRA